MAMTVVEVVIWVAVEVALAMVEKGVEIGV